MLQIDRLIDLIQQWIHSKKKQSLSQDLLPNKRKFIAVGSSFTFQERTMSPMHIRVAIVDDHPMVISGLKNMLHYYKNIDIIAAYRNGEELLDGLTKEQPDVLLLDIWMPGKTGNELVRIISKQYPDIRMLALTSLDTNHHVKDMLDNGCLGYLLKQTEPKTLLQAIEEVYVGNQYIDELLKEQLETDDTKKPGVIPSLTRREEEILQYVASGLTNIEIAKKLFLSPRTVKTHRLNLLQKLNVKNAAELIKIAMESGLIRSA